MNSGYEDGRQYGRSKKTGGQRRDDNRSEFDAGRGGWSLELQGETMFNNDTQYSTQTNKANHNNKKLG